MYPYHLLLALLVIAFLPLFFSIVFTSAASSYFPLIALNNNKIHANTTELYEKCLLGDERSNGKAYKKRWICCRNSSGGMSSNSSHWMAFHWEIFPEKASTMNHLLASVRVCVHERVMLNDHFYTVTSIKNLHRMPQPKSFSDFSCFTRIKSITLFLLSSLSSPILPSSSSSSSQKYTSSFQTNFTLNALWLADL